MYELECFHECFLSTIMQGFSSVVSSLNFLGELLTQLGIEREGGHNYHLHTAHQHSPHQLADEQSDESWDETCHNKDILKPYITQTHVSVCVCQRKYTQAIHGMISCHNKDILKPYIIQTHACKCVCVSKKIHTSYSWDDIMSQQRHSQTIHHTDTCM